MPQVMAAVRTFFSFIIRRDNVWISNDCFWKFWIHIFVDVDLFIWIFIFHWLIWVMVDRLIFYIIIMIVVTALINASKLIGVNIVILV